MPQYFSPEQTAKYAQQAQPSQDPSVSARKQDKSLFRKLGLPVLVGGNAADVFTTLQAMDRGGTEANPLLGDSKTRIALTKAATTAGTAFLLDKIAGKNRKAALIAALVGGAIPAAVAVRNSQQGKQ